MGDFLSDDDIRGNMQVGNESRLSLVNVTRRVVLKAVGKRFGNFTNRSKISRSYGLANFRNKSDKSLIYLRR
jgi:hypothetical protein